MTTKVRTAEIEATDGLDYETIIGELVEAACNIANSHEDCSIAIADQDGDNTFPPRSKTRGTSGRARTTPTRSGEPLKSGTLCSKRFAQLPM